jgi:RNA polymerase sigma-70 factor (ECF subfamily)
MAEHSQTSEIIQLVKKVQGGDEVAFSSLYDEFADRIYKFVRLKVSDAEQAEDLLQEIFVKAWQGCKKLDLNDLNFSAWLYRVASNTVNDHYRKVYRRPQTVELDPAYNLAGTDDTEKLTEDSFESEAMRKVVGDLPDNYKQIIELRYFQDFTVEETAQVLDKSSVTVRVLQHRAIKKLKQLFKENGQ